MRRLMGEVPHVDEGTSPPLANLQGYLAHKKTPPPQDPAVGLPPPPRTSVGPSA